MNVRLIVIVVAVVAIATGLAAGLSACPSKQPDLRAETSAGPSGVDRRATGDATLLLMADIRGILRPCGCTVELQKGGFDRLIPYLEEVRAQTPDARLLHAGPVFFEEATVDPKKEAQRDRQAEVAADLIAATGVVAAAATAVDVAASEGDYPALVERAKLSVTAANLELTGDVSVAPWVVQQIGTLKVGVFALASPAHAKELGGRGKIGDPTEAAQRAVAALRGKADVVVLLSALGLRDTKRLLRKVDGVHFAVAGGLGDHPVFSEEAELVGSARLMEFHREGRYLGRLTVRLVNGETDFADASDVSPAEITWLDRRITLAEATLARWADDPTAKERDLRSARHHLASLKEERDRLAKKTANVPKDRSSFSFTLVPLNWDLPQDPEIVAIMSAFDKELEAINVANAGTLPAPEPGQAVYVGVTACLDCHDEVTTFWENDRHEDAWETLEHLGKTFDAECISCHVTGYGKAGGSLVGQTAGREDVQCESCHGPGSLHAEDGDPELIAAVPKTDTCETCHNAHHSPKFDYGAYKPRLMVPGHGKPLK